MWNRHWLLLKGRGATWWLCSIDRKHSIHVHTVQEACYSFCLSAPAGCILLHRRDGSASQGHRLCFKSVFRITYSFSMSGFCRNAHIEETALACSIVCESGLLQMEQLRVERISRFLPFVLGSIYILCIFLSYRLSVSLNRLRAIDPYPTNPHFYCDLEFDGAMIVLRTMLHSLRLQRASLKNYFEQLVVIWPLSSEPTVCFLYLCHITSSLTNFLLLRWATFGSTSSWMDRLVTWRLFWKSGIL